MTRYLIAALLLCTGLASAQKSPEYKLLATSRTSTMEKEINEAAREGYRFAGTMGGDTHEGEIITIMRKLPDGDDKDRFQYKLLATNKLADGCRASPAAVGHALYVRTLTHLYRIEAAK